MFILIVRLCNNNIMHLGIILKICKIKNITLVVLMGRFMVRLDFITCAEA